MKLRTLAPAVVGLALAIAGPARPQGPTIAVGTYDDLKQAVLKERGKVVVVDFWSDGCLPCKQNMPHLVELHRKLADRGLAVITVSLDDLKKTPAVKAKLERFLARVEAPFAANLMLDDPGPLWGRLGFETIPTAFVFDRRGRWVKLTGDEFDPAALDRVVGELLAERP